jgi:hypothetical protein
MRCGSIFGSLLAWIQIKAFRQTSAAVKVSVVKRKLFAPFHVAGAAI